MRGIKAYVKTRVPTKTKLTTRPYVQVVSCNPWEPGEVTIGRVVHVDESIAFETPNKSCDEKVWTYLDHMSDGSLFNEIDTSLAYLRGRMISSVLVEISQTEMQKIPNRRILVSSDDMPICQQIYFPKGKAALKVKNQREINSAILPISRGYRADDYIANIQRILSRLVLSSQMTTWKSLY